MWGPNGLRARARRRLTRPRLEGHSFQDTQSYKSEAEIKAEWARDPLPKLKAFASKLDWPALEADAAATVAAALAEAEARGISSPERVTDNVFFEDQLQQ